MRHICRNCSFCNEEEGDGEGKGWCRALDKEVKLTSEVCFLFLEEAKYVEDDRIGLSNGNVELRVKK